MIYYDNDQPDTPVALEDLNETLEKVIYTIRTAWWIPENPEDGRRAIREYDSAYYLMEPNVEFN